MNWVISGSVCVSRFQLYLVDSLGRWRISLELNSSGWESWNEWWNEWNPPKYGWNKYMGEMLLTCCCLDTSWYIWIRHIRYHQIVWIMLGLPRQMARYQLTMRKSRAIQRAHIVCLARNREYTYLIFEACILTWTSTQVSWWYDTLKDILRLRSDCICTYIYIYLHIYTYIYIYTYVYIYIYTYQSISEGLQIPVDGACLGCSRLKPRSADSNPFRNYKARDRAGPRWHHGIRMYTGMFVGVYPPEKTHRPRKKMVFRGVAADIYIYIHIYIYTYIYIHIYIYSWVGGFMVSNVFNAPPYWFGGPQQTDSCFFRDGPGPSVGVQAVQAAQAEPLNACGVSEPQSRCPIGDPWGIPKSCGWKLRGFRLDERGTPPW